MNNINILHSDVICSLLAGFARSIGYRVFTPHSHSLLPISDYYGVLFRIICQPNAAPMACQTHFYNLLRPIAVKP